MTQFPEFFAALAAPFAAQEVKQRQAPGGRTLSYITARTVFNRLDEVAGPEGWWDEYVPMENSVVCKLSIRLPNGEVITKCDAGGHAGMADPGDDDKSGFSDAIKRAAAKFSVGRYLYRDGVPSFTQTTEPDTTRASGPTPTPTPSEAPRPPATAKFASGKELFAWLKGMETRHQLALVQHINAWAKKQRSPSGEEWPFKMVEWGPTQIHLAWEEAKSKLPVEEAPPEPPASTELAESDELLKLRREVYHTAVEVSKHQLGKQNDPDFKPGDQAVLTAINVAAIGNPYNKPALDTLKGCTDRLLLVYVHDQLLKDLNDAKALAGGA